MNLVVTGAGGYIGQRVLRAARERGWSVTAATRTAIVDPAVRRMRYALELPPELAAFPAGATVLHLAAETRRPDVDEGKERAAAERLIEIARARDLRVVFVSSQAASPEAPTAYGRSKWTIERAVLAAGGTVVRPGLVYGGPARGLFGQLVGWASGLAFLPALLPSPHVQPVHVDDLAEAICRIVERGDDPRREWNIAAREPMRFTAFLRLLALVRARRHPRWIPVPARLAIVGLGVARRVASGLPDPARLRSLVDTRPMSTAEALDRLGLELRDPVSGLHRSGSARRRGLLREARMLLRYVLAGPPPCAPMRRYARAVEHLRDGEPLSLPPSLERWPALVSLLERPGSTAPDDELAWRLDAATVLAEATTQGAHRFLLLGVRQRRAATAVAIAGVLAVEAAQRPFRWMLGPLLRRSLRSGDGRA